MASCNGWTNYETWLTNLWIDSYTQGRNPNFKSRDEVRDFVENKMIGEYALSGLNGLASDLLTNSLSQINYREIYECYKQDEDE